VYTQVDNSQTVAHDVGSKAVTGAILGALGGLVSGGGGQGAAQGAAGGATYGAASGAATPTALRYLTLEFEISSKRGGTQTGRVTRNLAETDMGPQEFIDAVIADYLEASLPKRR